MVKVIGIIAEDDSDVAVIKLLISKYKKPADFKSYHFVGRGCGKLRRKLRDWAVNLAQRGCTRLIVVHDRDQWNLGSLRHLLETTMAPPPILKHTIVIPVREIEAWLLTDGDAIKKALHIKGAVKSQTSTETLNDPKKTLRDLVAKSSGKTVEYIHTTHNPKIAAEITIKNLKKCPSYKDFDTFVASEC